MTRSQLADLPDVANLAQLAGFDEIIDVRTPSEFAEDHVPGAVNRPVLSDEERTRIGTLYKQVSAFNGRKLGAALVARNIAQHLEVDFIERPKSWRPLVYCWRGGKRSAAMVHILREIGWDAQRLGGGYKAYRRAVLTELPQLARSHSFRVICGLTGSGKSRLLETLERRGAQVLDLERLAAHRGSVLGSLPNELQPAQKLFESRIWWRLRSLDAKVPVFVESESKRIGTLQVPAELMEAMRESACVHVETAITTRVELLLEQYAHFLGDPRALGRQLDLLVPLHGRETIERWKGLAQQRTWHALVRELLERHYDPAYRRSVARHYPLFPQARRLQLDSCAESSFESAALELLRESTPTVA